MANKRLFRTSQEYSTTEVNPAAIPLFHWTGWSLRSPEEMQVGGAAPKHVLVVGNPDSPQIKFIAKCPSRWGPRECVIEAMLSTIGRMLPISVAEFLLVRLPTAAKQPDVRFMSRVFVRPGESLVHGIEIAGRYLQANNQELHSVFDLGNKRFEREFYTLEIIVHMLREIGRTEEERRRLVADFGRMVVFDAFVGVQDRHAENWGLIECSLRPEDPYRLAPIYDTARGLFVTHSDEDLAALAKGDLEKEVMKYAEKSKPVFGCICDDVTKINHFSLLEHMVTKLRADFGTIARGLVGAIDVSAIEKRLRIKYARMISRARMDLIATLLRYRHHRIREIVFQRGDA